MNDSIVIVLAVAVVLFILVRQASASSPEHELGKPPAGPTAPPGEMYRGSDLGPFASLKKIPGASQIYDVLAPINDKVIQPFVSSIRNSDAVTGLNQSLGGKPRTTTNPDGTITRSGNDTWYSRNIGSPISSAATGIGHAIGNLF